MPRTPPTTADAGGALQLGGLPGAKLERIDAGRALFTDRYDGLARQAMIMVNRPDRSGDTDWYLESWARCDWSEFPAARIRETGITIWTDTEGRPAPTYQIHSHSGPNHCGWHRITFIELGEKSYATGIEPSMVGSIFAEQDQARVRLPQDAADTGYRLKGKQLWLSADGERAFLGQRGQRFVAMLPRMIQPLLCA